MKKEHAERFSREVENYRKALLHCASNRDWETFKAKAERFFDYMESIEFRELRRRFINMFKLVLGIVIVSIIGLLTVDFGSHPELIRLQSVLFMSTVLSSTFELFFYINYRKYTEIKTVYYSMRKQHFIRGIEQDFRRYLFKSDRSKAA